MVETSSSGSGGGPGGESPWGYPTLAGSGARVAGETRETPALRVLRIRRSRSSGRLRFRFGSSSCSSSLS